MLENVWHGRNHPERKAEAIRKQQLKQTQSAKEDTIGEQQLKWVQSGDGNSGHSLDLLTLWKLLPVKFDWQFLVQMALALPYRDFHCHLYDIILYCQFHKPKVLNAAFNLLTVHRG